ncbi:rod shape-determining protein RodA [Candidatus Uhrbacteria bacterium]|nr:rod shape-determining protein RodA [Candidatus Uhrbacteria bacterium]
MQLSWPEFFRKIDWLLIGALFALSAIGLLMIYGIGTSYEITSLLQFRKQLIAVAIGVTSMAALMLWDYRRMRAYGLIAYAIGLLLLVGVLIFGIEVRGTQGWFRLGTVSIQPVEIAKVLFALFLASYFYKQVHRRLDWITFFGSLLAMSIYVGLIMLQPDLGSAMVVLMIWFVGVAFAGMRKRTWALLISAGVLIIYLSWSFLLAPYQQQRLTSFLNPEADPLGAGYNVLQAQTAIGSGGWFGKGIGEGSQSRLRFLPEASTDFMFAVMGEELGFAGLALILILFAVVLLRILAVGYASRDIFVQTFTVMITGMFAMHILVNAGMNMGIMPVTGIPLPFASAAASSLVAGYLAIGIVLNMRITSKSADKTTALH